MPTIADLTLARALAAALGLRIVIVAGTHVAMLRAEDGATVETAPTKDEAVTALEAWGWRQQELWEVA